MLRVISYVDGFNLYFGLRSKGWRKYYWLDLVKLSKALMKSHQRFVHCHYFTARISTSGSQSQDAHRQSIWLDALGTLPELTTHYGHYLPKTMQCKHCGAQWTTHEEKMTDVNIAAQMLADAYEDRFDVAMVISADSDLTTPVRLLRKRFPQKRIIVVFPPDRRSAELQKTAHGMVVLGQDKLRQNLLPENITTSSGFVLTRPPQWR